MLDRISFEDAIAKTTVWLREEFATRANSYRHAHDPGFQFSIRSLISAQLRAENDARTAKLELRPIVTQFDEASNTSPYIAAVWELVRRGILVPGLRRTEHGLLESSGTEFRITEYGERFLEADSTGTVLPSEHGRFMRHLESHAHRFRSSYVARASEALACYRATVFYACCAMCGAAAESILLSLSIAQAGNEDAVLRDYRTSQGTSKLIRRLSAQKNSVLHQRLEQFHDIIKYWRDEAAHAMSGQIDEEQAFISLLLLLRLARFADERWDELVSPPAV